MLADPSAGRMVDTWVRILVGRDVCMFMRSLHKVNKRNARWEALSASLTSSVRMFQCPKLLNKKCNAEDLHGKL
jgi:hypothetical protein